MAYEDDLKGIQAARDAGYDDDAIASHLATSRPEYGQAIKAGYKLSDIEDHLRKMTSPSTIQGPASTSPESTQDFGLKEKPYPDNIPAGPSERSPDEIASYESRPEFDESVVGQAANATRVAARTIGSGIASGVKGILELDPAAVYSRMDEKDRKAAEDHLESQLAPAREAIAADAQAKNPRTGNFYGDEVRELERHKALIQRGLEIKGDPTADPSLYEESLKPEELAKSYETDPDLEGTKAATIARIGGGIGGFVAEGAINPALPMAQMVASASSEAGDAAVAKAKENGETDETKLAGLRDHASKKAAAYAAATIPIYLAGGAAATTAGKALGPTASALTKAAVETGVSAASNLSIGAGMRRLENGNWSLPNGEQVSQDIGWALLHGYGAYKGAPNARPAEQQEFKKSIQAISDDQFDAAIKQFRSLSSKDPRRATFEAEIVRRGEPGYRPTDTAAAAPTAAPTEPPPSETPQAPDVQQVSQPNTGTSNLFRQAQKEKADALRSSVTPEAQALAPATAESTIKLADSIENTPPKAEVETPVKQPIAEKKAPAETTVDPKESAPVEPISQQEQPGGSAQAEPPANLTPAVKTEDGIATGENHPEIIEREGLEPEVRESPDAGFVTDKGEFKTREQAAEETGLPTDTEEGKLHSSDFPKKTFPKLDEFEKSLEEDPTPKRAAEMSKDEKLARLEQELKDAPNRDKKAIRVRIKALSEEPSPDATQEPEATEQPKEIWQKTREEVKSEGGSLARHSLEVKDALKKGKQVPLEVLEDFKGREWADNARQKIYGEEVSDTLFGRIAKALEDDPTKLYSDPLLIQTIGKPVLRQAVKVLRTSLEAGNVAKDAVEDAIAYLRANAPSFTEDKVRTLLGNLVSFEKPEIKYVLPERAEKSGDKLVSVNIGKFDPAFQKDKGFYVSPTGEGAIKGRREGFQEFLKTGNPVEAPEVHVDAQGGVSFINGRHRYSVIRDNGETSIPMAMSAESRANAEKFGLTEKKGGDSDEKRTEEKGQKEGVLTPPGEGEKVPSQSPEPADHAAYNAATDKALEEAGFDPIAGPARKTLGDSWNEALAATAKARLSGEDLGGKLVDELNEKPRTLKDDVESGILLKEIADRKKIQANAQARVDEADTSGDEAAQAEAAANLSIARDRTYEAITAAKKTGTEWGRAGRFRQIHIDDDYNITSMEAKVRSEVNNGKPLTEKQAAEVKASAEEIEKAKKYDEIMESAKKDAEASSVADDLQKKVSKQAEQSEAKGKGFLDFIHEQAANARKRIIARRGAMYMAVEPVTPIARRFVDETIIGASYIADKIVDFSRWSRKMIADFGPRVSPHLPEIFKLASEKNAELQEQHAKANDPEQSNEKEVAKLVSEQKSAGADLNPKIVYDLAVLHAKDGVGKQGGVEGMNELIKAVHADLAPDREGLTERDVRDAFSGYGKVKHPSEEEIATQLREVRRLSQLQSGIEDALNKIAPKKSGTQRDKPTAAVREQMRKLQDAMRKSGIETVSPEQQLASVNAARERAIQNRIEDINNEISTGKKPTKLSPVADSDQVKYLKAERQRLQDQLDAINEAKNPKKTPEQIQNERYRTLLAKRKADLESRQAAGNFSKPVRNKLQLDRESEKAKADYERAKQKFDTEVEKQRLANRTKSQKFWDTFVHVERAMKLTSAAVFGKLGVAAAARGVLTPIEEGVGAVIGKALPKLAARAPREGGFSKKAEAKAIAATFTKGMKDAAANLRMKKSNLDVLHNKNRMRDIPPAWYEYMGFLHSALKAPIKRAEFERSLSKRVQWAQDNGEDISNPSVMTKLSQEAYADANKSIFMQDNPVTKAFSGGKRILENMKGNRTQVALAKGGARALDFFFPIVKVPTNIVGEAFTGATGSVSGAIQAARAYADGIEKLPPEEADAILRQLKKGAIGGAALAFGYLAANSVGGFYRKEDQRGESDIKPGQFKIGGKVMPKWFGHTPAAMLINVGATIRRTEEERNKKTGSKKGFATGAAQGGLGFARELPFVPAVTNMIEAVGSENGFEKYIATMLAGSVEPSILPQIARTKDTQGSFPKNIFEPANVRESRSGEGVTPRTVDELKAGIPGLRETLPLKRHRLKATR